MPPRTKTTAPTASATGKATRTIGRDNKKIPPKTIRQGARVAGVVSMTTTAEQSIQKAAMYSLNNILDKSWTNTYDAGRSTMTAEDVELAIGTFKPIAVPAKRRYRKSKKATAAAEEEGGNPTDADQELA